MDRAIKPITARIGGVEIIVSAQARRGIRRRARQAAVVIGYVAGIGAGAMAAVAVAQSTLLLPVLACAAVTAAVAWRCRG